MLQPDDYQWLFRKSPAMATSIGEDGTYVDVNDAFLARLGYDHADMVGHKPYEFVTPESARRIDEEFLPALRRTGKLENKPIGFVSSSGEVVECMTNSIVEYDPDGSFVRTIALYREYDDQARANFKYRELYRLTPAMLHTLDADGQFDSAAGAYAVAGKGNVDFWFGLRHDWGRVTRSRCSPKRLMPKKTSR